MRLPTDAEFHALCDKVAKLFRIDPERGPLLDRFDRSTWLERNADRPIEKRGLDESGEPRS